MKLLDRLFGHKPEPEPRWQVRPAGERPLPRACAAQTAPDPAPTTRKKHDNPFLDTDFAGFELVDDTPDRDDPYESSTWKRDPHTNSRKLEKVQIGKRTEKERGEDFNPYDTGVFKRGWK